MTNLEKRIYGVCKLPNCHLYGRGLTSSHHQILGSINFYLRTSPSDSRVFIEIAEKPSDEWYIDPRSGVVTLINGKPFSVLENGEIKEGPWKIKILEALSEIESGHNKQVTQRENRIIEAWT